MEYFSQGLQKKERQYIIRQLPFALSLVFRLQPLWEEGNGFWVQVFLLAGVLLGVFAVAEIYDQQNTPELTVNCKGRRKKTAEGACLRFPATFDMASDANIGRYLHNDNPFEPPYLDIPYSFRVPGLRSRSHRRSVYSGGGWRKGYLTIYIHRVSVLDANLVQTGWRYSVDGTKHPDTHECHHMDEDGHSLPSPNSWEMKYTVGTP